MTWRWLGNQLPLQQNRNILEHLGLTRILRKDWKSIGKNDIEKLVYEIMQNYSDPSGKETNYSYDHKKVLKIFFRWMKLGSREFVEVGDPPETARVRMKKVRDKIIREDLLTEDDISRLLFACGENARDRAFIDCHYEGGTRIIAGCQCDLTNSLSCEYQTKTSTPQLSLESN